ncbi:hypothetical protein D3C72_2148550 [compost metagenome]
MQLAQVVTVLLEAAALLPEIQDPRVVLPAVETLQIAIDFQGTQRHPGPQAGIETTIHLTPWFRRAARMALALGDLHLLRVDTGNRLA